VLCLAPLAAAAQEIGATTLSQADIQKFEALARDKHEAEHVRLASLSNQQISDALQANLANKTKIIFQQGYGVYVEYSSGDGQDRMWFPGNQGVVKGNWGVREMGGGPRACFHYFNSRNAVTHEFESTECVSPEQTLSGENVLDERAGDVFGLLADRIPYRKSPLSVPAWP